MLLYFIYLLELTIQKQICIVFFSGGSNLITPNLYSNFLKKLDNKYDIYKIPFTLNKDKSKKKYEEVINLLDNKYDNIIFMGHSSGCTTIINNCNNKVNKLILLDPVKTPFYKKKNLNYLENIIFINAEKSYKWSIIPPFTPFIPFFKIDSNELIINKNKILEITIHNFGHCDIIDNPWRNIMHYSRISVGNNKRNIKYINNYHKLLSEYIKEFVNTNVTLV